MKKGVEILGEAPGEIRAGDGSGAATVAGANLRRVLEKMGRDGRGRESSTSSREDREPRGNRERTPRPETDRPDRTDRTDRTDRPDRTDRSDQPDRTDRSDQPDRTDRTDRSDQPDQAAPAAGPSVGSVTGELGEIGQFLLGTIERMGLGTFEISESKDGEMVVLQVKGPAGQMLSSGQGRTVDALQLLVNQVSVRLGPDRQRVVIDVEGDADAREEFLGKLADRVAKRALQTGRAVALDPMNGRDRRLIHMALRDREDVATMSEGEGRYRQVVVVPENSDEFEEARAKSERAGSNN